MAGQSGIMGRALQRPGKRIAQAFRALLHLPYRIATERPARSRALAGAAFAAIFAFAAFSLDALLTGAGPDWNPGAIAMPTQFRAPRLVAPSRLAIAEPPSPIAVKVAIDEPMGIEQPREDLLGGPETLAVSAAYSRPPSLPYATYYGARAKPPPATPAAKNALALAEPDHLGEEREFGLPVHKARLVHHGDKIL
jgi:hypothetical protein